MELNKNKVDYLYRRQFILSPKKVHIFKSCNYLQICDNLFLSAHSDLGIAQAHYDNKSIYLLGFILDPNNIKISDYEILSNILKNSKNEVEVFEQLSDKCGRFIIILKFGSNIRIFSDACGTRQIFYHIDKSGNIWCASQPHLIANELGIQINLKTKHDLMKSSVFKSDERWFPGRITLYDNVFHLTPNHYLDLTTYKSIRYWPNKFLRPQTIEQALPKVQRLLTGIIKAAVYRYRTGFAISCGYDSRTLLATSKQVSNKIHFITQTSKDRINTDPDVIIPTKLLKKLGLHHNIILLPNNFEGELFDIFQSNVQMARKGKGINAISIYDQLSLNNENIVMIYGNCSEITKRDRFRFPKTPKLFLNGFILASMAQMSRSKIAIREFGKWIAEAKHLTKYNLNLLDLMHWEQRVGNWGAMTFSEYEMFFESLCPYSCRKYIENMLRVPFKFRTNPNYIMHYKIMESCWPDVLDFGINPETNLLKKHILNFLYLSNIYDLIKLPHIIFIKRFK
ncbi:MAG: hypothetical protein KQI78_06800 [Deltaproteobacteria bacterium]|nr:hypothetical protein [Deltaproteobacteria bacterium]